MCVAKTTSLFCIVEMCSCVESVPGIQYLYDMYSFLIKPVSRLGMTKVCMYMQSPSFFMIVYFMWSHCFTVYLIVLYKILILVMYEIHVVSIS